MRLVYDADELEFQHSLRRFYGDTSPEPAVRRLMDTDLGYDPGVWKRMATELDLPGIALPQEAGGSEAGQRMLTLVFEEQGRALFGGPYLSTVGLAGTLLAACPSGAGRSESLAGIVSGTLLAAVAHAERGDARGPGDIAATAQPSDEGWTLSGTKPHVLDAACADLLLVTAGTPDGPGVFAVERLAPGVSVSPAPTIDLTRRYAHVTLSGAPGRALALGEQAWAAVRRTLDVGGICLAAEQVGGAQRLLELTTEYARLRTQFGRVIGSFQAIKHQCVDMLVAVEGARAALYEASWAADDPGPATALTRAAALAQAAASQVYCDAARTAVQVHGGIGFTWEHPAHLYYRRAHASRLFLGDERYHHRVLAQLLLEA